MTYYDFEIWIRAQQPNSYAILVTAAPSGPASGTMRLDLTDATMQSLLPTVLAATEDVNARQAFGELLFESLFNGTILEAWKESLGRARGAANQGLRLRLWIDAPELSLLPWELLYDKPNFLAVSGEVLVSRFLPAGEPPAFVTPEKARVLLVIQEPPDQPVLPEVPGALEAAFQKLTRFAAPKILKNATLAEVNNELLRGYEALHYMGHGAPDKLLLASDKEVAIKDGHEFAALFSGQPGLQLVVLNVCASGATMSRGMFSGIGPFLAEKRLPAVVAMQYNKIFQRTAAEFNAAFYAALNQSLPVDVAVNAARRSLILNHAAERDWSTPVLYMTTRTGRVLEFVDNPVEAALRNAEFAKEHAQREAAIRELIVNLDDTASALREIENAMDMLRAAQALQQRLNAIPRGLSVTQWRAIRQVELSDLHARVKDTAAEQSPWWLRLLPASAALTSNLNSSNRGSAERNREELENALRDGLGELEKSVTGKLRECVVRASAAVARFRIQ